MGDLFSVIADFLLIFDRWKFDKKKKKRREFEKENNLPKKIMIYPLWTLFGIFIIFIIISKLIIGNFHFSYFGIKRTKTKISKIIRILENEKTALGKYPEKLKTIERNNPLRKNITLDYWGNEFHYEQKENGLKYILISKGNDGMINTDDDIIIE